MPVLWSMVSPVLKWCLMRHPFLITNERMNERMNGGEILDRSPSVSASVFSSVEWGEEIIVLPQALEESTQMMRVEGLYNSIEQHSPWGYTHTGLLLQAEKIRWLPLECDQRGPMAPSASLLLFYCLKIPPLDVPFSKGFMLPMTQKRSLQLAGGKTAMVEEKRAPFLCSSLPFSLFPLSQSLANFQPFGGMNLEDLACQLFLRRRDGLHSP